MTRGASLSQVAKMGKPLSLSIPYIRGRPYAAATMPRRDERQKQSSVRSPRIVWACARSPASPQIAQRCVCPLRLLNAPRLPRKRQRGQRLPPSSDASHSLGLRPKVRAENPRRIPTPRTPPVQQTRRDSREIKQHFAQLQLELRESLEIHRTDRGLDCPPPCVERSEKGRTPGEHVAQPNALWY